jgi:hypothetical protein
VGFYACVTAWLLAELTALCAFVASCEKKSVSLKATKHVLSDCKAVEGPQRERGVAVELPIDHILTPVAEGAVIGHLGEMPPAATAFVVFCSRHGDVSQNLVTPYYGTSGFD